MEAIYHLIFIYLMIWMCDCQTDGAIPGEKDKKNEKYILPPPKVCGQYLGCVEGKYMDGYYAKEFEAFLGIPYALPPVQNLRFTSPIPLQKFNSTYNATEIKPDCIQKNYLLPNPVVQGDEDCLYLNVYRPIRSDNKYLPVMVYIHGGGWFSGTSSPLIHGPEYFMDTREVILVTFNYRLGPFGFLSTSDEEISGNFGLKDQNLVLRWVERNIGAFNGHNRRVTIFGQSAGAISAHMHVLSKQSNYLFRNIIALSGTANVPFAITENPLAQAREVAKFCNITDYASMDTAKLAHALRDVDAVKLINAGDGLKYWDVDPLTTFRPVVESSKVRDAFFLEHPKTIMLRKSYRPVPWMTGFVPNEGAVRAIAILENDQLKKHFNNNFMSLLEKLLELPENFNSTHRKVIMSKVIQEYFSGEEELNDKNELGLLDVISDRGFLVPLYNAINMHVHRVPTISYPVYLYHFNYQGKSTFSNIYTGHTPSRNYGVVHCDDLIYLFRMPALFPDFPKRSADAMAMRAFVDNFVHFARTGVPRQMYKIRPCNTKNLNRRDICDYQEFVNNKYSKFELRIGNSFRIDKVLFWNQLLNEPKL